MPFERWSSSTAAPHAMKRAAGELRRWHGRFDALDGLRWFASIQVVLSHQSDIFLPFLWSSIWTQMFFLLSGFVLAYSEMVRPKGVPPLSCWQYTWRRLRKIYPAYLIMIGVSMLQKSHTEFAWKTLILNVLLLQTWIPLVDESHGLQSVTGNWVGVSWFLSALLLYWQILRPAARLATRMSMKLALCSLLCLWLWTLVLLVIWRNVQLVSGYFMMLILHQGPLGYFHVFLSGVVLARVFVLLIYIDADSGEAPDGDTERLTLRHEAEMQLPGIFQWGTMVALLCYLPLFALPVGWESPWMAMCHNGGMLPMMCLLLLALSSEMDLMASCLGSSAAKVLGRISYCQYIIQGNVRLAMLEPLHQHFWLTFPVFLLVLITCAYLLELFVSLLLDRVCHDVLQEPARLVVSESTDESSSEEHPSTTDLWACGL